MTLPPGHVFAGLPARAAGNHEAFLDGRVTLHCGDCIEVMATLPENSVDSVVCDPPYHLTSIVKRFGSATAAPAKGNEAFKRASAGFMGKQWDGGDIAFQPETWAAMYRVLKPGAHLLAFGGTRTFHRLVCAIEDAGFEVRDCIVWAFGQGFPKSHDVSKGIDKTRGEINRELEFCTFMRSTKIAREEANRILQDAGMISTNGTMAGHFFAISRGGQPAVATRAIFEVLRPYLGVDVPIRIEEIIDRAEAEREKIGERASGDPCAWFAQVDTGDGIIDVTAPATDAARQWDGWGTALKPAMEPICLARKPLSEGTVAANVLKWRTGAMNIDGCRVGSESTSRNNHAEMGYHGGNLAADYSTGSSAGRWPANLIHDGSDEVVAAFPDADGAVSNGRKGKAGLYEDGICAAAQMPSYNDSGSAARFFASFNGRDGEASAERRYTEEGSTNFAALPGARRDGVEASRLFYTSKADGDDRLGSRHPTVKPIDLVQYLVRLVTPKGGTVLDPFAGTGTTGEAAFREGMRAVLIEREAEYQADIRRRMALVLAGPDERVRESIKARGMVASPGPLFETLRREHTAEAAEALHHGQGIRGLG